jgi:hypothetical protein
MTEQEKSRRRVPSTKVVHVASGARLMALVANFRRKGYTAHFGVDRDPKKVHNA